MFMDPVDKYSRRVSIGVYGHMSRDMTVLENPTRQAIVYLLATRGPLTLKDISSELKLAPSTVYEHLRRLKETGFITEASEHPKRFKVEVFYRLTLPFILTSEMKTLEEKLAPLLEQLKDSITKTVVNVEENLKHLGLLKYVNNIPENQRDQALKHLALVLVARATHMFLYELVGGSFVYALINDLEE